MDHPATTPPNGAAYDYLEYYLGLNHPPKYAVLVNGSWGAGKTHLIQKLLANNFAPQPTGFRGWLSASKKAFMQSWIGRWINEEASERPDPSYIYISLYGTDSIDDINDRIICSALPGLKVNTAKIIGGITRSALKYFRFETPFTLKHFISKFHKQLYVFDDFERSNLPSKILLGYINEFVEYGDKKVIIIANEDEIAKKEVADYLNTREKVIGKSLTIQATPHEALEHFTNSIQNAAARRFITGMQHDIICFFQQAESNNLRFLRQTLWDFERLFAILTPQQQKNTQAMTALAKIIFIFSIEIRQKKISAADILARPKQTIEFLKKHSQKKPEEQPFLEMEQRHPTVDLRDPILPNPVLYEVLIQGVLNLSAIQSSLMSSVYFQREEDMPALDVLRHPYELTEERFRKTLVQFEDEYKERIFISSEDLFQTFSLRLWLSSTKALHISHDRVLAQGKQYLQDLYEAKKLPILTQRDLDDVKFSMFTGRYRMPFQAERSKHAEAYFLEFQQLSNQAQNDLYVEIATQFLEDMKHNAERLIYRLAYSSYQETDHINPAILLLVPCSGFVSTLLDLHPRQQQAILGAFRARYGFTPINAMENGEHDWLLNVRELILAAAEKLSQFEQQRLSSNVQNFIDPYIDKISILNYVRQH